MADSKNKGPEELGEAVGQKIDELFGGIFEDQPAKGSRDDGSTSRPSGPESRRPRLVDSTGRGTPASAVTPPQTPEAGRKGSDNLLDRVEALILELEWEMSHKTVEELSRQFDNLPNLIPTAGPARTALDMSQRVLQRFSNPDASPHPLLVKLLQDSVAVIKQVVTSEAISSPDKALMAKLANTYKQIMASRQLAAPAEAPPTMTPAAPQVALVLRDVAAALSSLEHLSQRLTTTLGAWRQAGQVSWQEVTLRLGKLDSLLSEKVDILTKAFRKLSQGDVVEQTGSGGVSQTQDRQKFGPDGLLLIAWHGVPLAVPSSMIAALHPVPRASAQQLIAKQVVTIGNVELKRLPLRKPTAPPQQTEPIPSWLIHLSIAGKDYFVLADRALGYRRTPKTMNIAVQNRIRIGNVSYAVLNPEGFR